MKNGRCRMHGGKSTGPRTREGRDRIRSANLKHGRYSQSTRKKELLDRLADKASMIRLQIAHSDAKLLERALRGYEFWPSSSLTLQDRGQLSRIYRRWHQADPENLAVKRVVQQLDGGQVSAVELDALLRTNLNVILDTLREE